MLIDDARRPASSSVEQRADGFGRIPALRLRGREHVGCVSAHVRQMQLAQQVDDLIDRRGGRSGGHDATSPKRFPRSRGWLHRVVLVGASSLPDGVRGEDRGEITVTESFEAGGVTERPVDPVDTVQLGELHRFGHLHLDPRRARCGGLDRATSVRRHRAPGTRLRQRCPVVVRGPTRRPGVAGSGRHRCAGCLASTAGVGQPRPRLARRCGWRRSRRRRHEPTPLDRSACAGPSR